MMSNETGQSYEEFWLAQSLSSIRFSCVLGAIAILFFYRIDEYYLGDYAYVMQSWRIYYMLPAIITWFGLTFHPTAHRYIFWVISTTGLPFGLSFVHSLYLAGPPATLYVGIALMQVCLFVVLLFNMPARFMVPPVVLFVAALLATMIARGVPYMDQVLALTSVLSVSMLGGAVSILSERRQRTSYLQREEIRRLRRDATEKQRLRLSWFEGFSGFVRHELRNALSGVNTSVQMIQRHAESQALTRYSERAQRSAEFMSRMLDRTVEASSLEAALTDDRFDPVNLVELGTTKITEYAETYPSIEFEVHSKPGLVLMGNGDRFEQVVDKLLINAIEHSDEREPIILKIYEEQNSILFSIENSGDELPTQVEAMFDVFFSTKSGGSDNLGIGLYVARTIVEHMGGKIVARKRSCGSGAVFRFELPKTAYSNQR